MPRAARRQPIVLSSDDEADVPPPSPQQRSSSRSQRLVTKSRATKSTAKGTAARARSSQAPSSLLSTPATTQEPSSARLLRPSQPKKSPSKSPAKLKAIHKPISSFFSAIPARQQSGHPPDLGKSAAAAVDEDEDFIQDSSQDEGPVRAPDIKSKSVTALALRKRTRNTLGEGLRGDGEGAPGGSQKFLKTQRGTRGDAPLALPPIAEVVDQRPWTERFGPTSLDELAVHKRKVTDVRTWLHQVFEGRERKRLLLLKGPAGSGKTTTISLLAGDLGFETHEWKNPTNTAFADGGVSVSAQFEDFLGRTGKFGSLEFQETGLSDPKPKLATKLGREKEVILVEEFPNTFTPSSTSVQAFRSSIQQFLATNTPSMGAFLTRQKDHHHSVTPMILIISETLLSTNTAAADSFTAHRLLGPEILNHSAVTTIEFNPIAPTLMAKALELVVKKEARVTGRRKTAGPQVIQRISDVGDIRSAIASLEFLCVRGDDQDGWGAKVAFTKPKKGTREAALTEMEQESLEIITQRESTLGIFHAVGKVVHNKRDAPISRSDPIPQPPNYFPELRRPKVSQVNVDGLIDDLGTDIQTFIAALHENYLLSCDGGDSEVTLDSINGCIDALSDADLLSPDRFGSGAAARLTFQGTSADNLRQDELSFQVSVRGLLFSLPSPVKRISPPPGTTSSKGRAVNRTAAYSMFYPTSLRIWRQREEIEGLVDVWINRAQSGELYAPLVQATRKDLKVGGVDSWKRNGFFSQATAPQSHPPSTPKSKAEEEPAPILLGSGSSAKHEMLLERLPYIAILLRNRISVSAAASLRDIEKVTAFHGIGGSSEEALDDDDGDTDVEQWSTDRPDTEKRRKQKLIKSRSIGRTAAIPTISVEKDVAKLVLSDDDIEDD